MKANRATVKHPTHIVGVFGLIQNSANEVLMIENPVRGWELPGGHVEEGEGLIQALEREVLEETGVTAEINRLVGVYCRTDSPYMLLMGFTGRYRSGDLTPSEESLVVEWVAPEQVIGRIAHPAIRDRVQDLLAGNERVVYRSYSTDPYRVHDRRCL